MRNKRLGLRNSTLPLNSSRCSENNSIPILPYAFKSRSKRFVQYEEDAKKTRPHVGPGCYNVECKSTADKHKERLLMARNNKICFNLRNNAIHVQPRSRQSPGPIIRVSTPGPSSHRIVSPFKIKSWNNSMSLGLRNKREKNKNAKRIQASTSPMETYYTHK